MGVLDDAIRDHLALKRKHGADEADLARAEAEALGPARREPAADPYVEDSASYGETGGSAPYDAQADETATTPFDHQGGVTYEPPAPEAPTRIAPAPAADAPPPEEPAVEEPPAAAYEPPAEPSFEHPPGAEPYEPPPVEHPPPAEPYVSPPVEHAPPVEPYEPPPAEHPPAAAAYEPPAPAEPPPAEPYEHTPAPAAETHDPKQPELGGDDPHDYEDFSYKGEPEPPGYAAAAEDPAVPGHDEPVGQGDPLAPYSWHREEADAPHEDPRAPREEPEALHGAEVVHEEEEVVHEPEVVQDAEVVHEATDEEPAPSPVGEHDDTAVKPPDEAYREAAAQQPTEYFTPPDVQPVEESRGRRLRRLFSRKSDR